MRTGRLIDLRKMHRNTRIAPVDLGHHDEAFGAIHRVGRQAHEKVRFLLHTTAEARSRYDGTQIAKGGRMSRRIHTALALCALILGQAVVPANQTQAAQPAAQPAAAGKLDKIRVHSPSLDGNLQGNNAARDVHIYLPPGYDKGHKRYPVIYFLHGYGVTADIYVDSVLHIPAATDKAMTTGARETIVVTPDAFTRFGGSFYSNSPMIGDWESWIAKDLVAYIDSHYRTVAKRQGVGDCPAIRWAAMARCASA